MSLTRKEFLSTVMNAAAGAAGAALLVACGGSSDDDDTGGNCLMAGASANISGNHGHTLSVSAADIMRGTAATYDITGSATDHGHMVTISVGAFAMLANNESAMTVSTSGGGHTHNIMITCR